MRRSMLSIASLALMASVATASFATAEEPRPLPTIEITGVGHIAMKPDVAELRLSVLSDGATAKDALQKNSERMAKVIAIAKAAGIESKDLSTAQIAVNPRYIIENNAQKQKGFEARNTLELNIRDFNKIGGLIDESVTAGANAVEGLSFDVGDKTAAKLAAYAAAVEDAMGKAKVITEKLGVKLGDVQHITESFNGPSSPRPMAMALMADARAKSMEVPVEAGEIDQGAQVNVVWAVK